MDRRQFLVSGVAGGGFLLTARLSLALPVDTDTHTDASTRLDAYVEVTRDGHVVITAPVPEIGQGVRTSLPMLVAEEMDADWNNVSVVQARGSDDFEGRWQRAAGSLSVRVFWLPMRHAGAVARDLMLRAAAQAWSVSASECTVSRSRVTHSASGRAAHFGELAPVAATLAPKEGVPLKAETDFELLGSRVSNVDAATIVRGESLFGADTRISGMLYASIERCPVYGGRPVSWDDSAAKNVTGYITAIPIEAVGNADRPYVRPGIAVVAETTWACLKARRALQIEWDEGPNSGESTRSLRSDCLSLLDKVGSRARDDGNVDAAFEDARTAVEATYHLPLIVHTPMETMNCTAYVQEDKAEVWVPTQMPHATRSSLASALSLPPDQIEVNVTQVGGGFGRRLSTDFVTEAVRISAQTEKPVQVIWTREDEIQQGEFRPFSLHRLRASLDDDNRLAAWHHRQAGTSRYAFRRGRAAHESEFFNNAFPAGLVPNLRLEYMLANSNLPRTIIRAPGHNALAFAIECFIDELAHAAQLDPLEFRLHLYGEGNEFLYDDEEEPGYRTVQYDRFRNLVQTVADATDWRRPLRPGHGKGIACHYTFGTYVAHVVEVMATDNIEDLSILRVTSAIDCGYAVNPQGVEAQVEGAVIDGLSTALYGEINIEKGVVQESNFDTYRLLPLAMTPEIDVHIIASDKPVSGIGEPPFPPVAPALCNAIFSATGQRLRHLPLVPPQSLS